MKRSIRLSLLALAASGGLVAATTGPAVAEGDTTSGGASNGEVQQTIHAVGDGHAVRLSASRVYSGSIRFAVSSTNPQNQNGGGSAVSLFRLKPGKDLGDVTRALHEEFSQNPATAAKGTRDIVATAIVRGLADVVPHFPETVTEFLSPGTYWAMDLANPPVSGPPQFTRLVVRPAIRHIEQDSDLRSQVMATTVDDHFQVSTTNWPHEGTYTFSNHADVIHFMQLQRVKPGTTDRDVQRFFDSILNGKNNVPPPFAPGPTGGNDVVSPGFSLQVTYDLPAGRYVLLCFVADEQTGIPHAFMGMHKVIVLH